MKKVAFIMAGGHGERFWPRSRKSCPKQFLSLTGDGKTMLQHSAERILPFIPLEDILISTQREYADLVRRQLPGIPPEHLLFEPAMRNTAPCIGLSAVAAERLYGDALMIVLPSDHMIQYTQLFVESLQAACAVAEQEACIVTLGITPSYPETGYGYIRFDPNAPVGRAYRVEQFVEKPDLETAKAYVASEKYLWNSGMFVFRASTYLTQLRGLLPDVYHGLMEIRSVFGTPEGEAAIKRIYPTFPNISVDFGVMEHATDLVTLPGAFGWDDVGSWLALERLNTQDARGNVLRGDVVDVDARGCIVEGNGRLIALVEVEDLVVVDAPDTLLVCHKNAAQHVKKVIARLSVQNRNDLL